MVAFGENADLQNTFSSDWGLTVSLAKSLPQTCTSSGGKLDRLD